MTAENTRRMHLGVSASGAGLHRGAWRHAGSPVDDFPGPRKTLDLARTAERGRFDLIFLSDTVGMNPELLAGAAPSGSLEPLMQLAAISQATDHIGLVATASTTFSQPYTLARQLATLDHISGGRAGWNLVTSSAGAENYGHEPLPPHAERYRRAAEFADVVFALWGSWDPDALVLDRTSGRFAEPDAVHPLDHAGEYFSVAGPLNVPRSPQGRPVVFQAGSSPEGQAVAARYADAVFTAQRELGPAMEFRAGMRAQAAAVGRDPEQIRIMPGLVPIVGSTEAEAWRIQQDLLDLVDSDTGRQILEGQLDGIDLSGLPLDEPLPPDLLPPTETMQGRQSRYGVYRDLAVNQGWPLRRLIQLEVSSNGHWPLVGTPEQVADQMATVFLEGAVDGFNVIPPQAPAGFEVFVDEVIPLLQKRGIYRRDYETTTLREHLGLPAGVGLQRPGRRRAPQRA